MNLLKTSLNEQGYFIRAGRRFIPFGVNYWPGSCGVEMWTRWPEKEIQTDLDLAAELGLNCTRFFLRWQDFEMEAGTYDERLFRRLEQLLEWHRQRNLVTNPSIFVGWMSGGLFWPAWKGGRNFYADPWVVERAVGFTHRVMQSLLPFADTLLAVDLGNELDCVKDCQSASPGDIRSWCETICRTIHAVMPDVLITSGNEHGQVIADTGWRLGQQPGVNVNTMHVYPMPLWHSLGFDGMTDPLCQSMLTACTAIACLHGPTLLQEFGTIATFGETQQDTYLRGLLPAVLKAGANGFLWWSLRDITAPCHPYPTNHFESTLGLVGVDGKIKPGLEYYLEFGKELNRQALALPEPAEVGIYIPEQYYPHENPDSTGQHPRDFSPGLFLARYLLEQAGVACHYVGSAALAHPDLITLIVPGIWLTAPEAERIGDWVAEGGRLLWNGPDPINWGSSYARLLGARVVDYRPPEVMKIHWAKQDWEFTSFPRNLRAEVRPDGAEILARDAADRPVLLLHQLGKGRVVACLAAVEAGIARFSQDRSARDRWIDFYKAALQS
jgi:hypothetical protein